MVLLLGFLFLKKLSKLNWVVFLRGVFLIGVRREVVEGEEVEAKEEMEEMVGRDAIVGVGFGKGEGEEEDFEEEGRGEDLELVSGSFLGVFLGEFPVNVYSSPRTRASKIYTHY